MIVYRIEDIFGYGPYCCDNIRFSHSQKESLVEMKDSHQGFNHPTFGEDGIESEFAIIEYRDGRRHVNPDYFFAFDSMDKLSKWFLGFECTLAYTEFNVAEYEIDEKVEGNIATGRRQVIFKRANARLSKVQAVRSLMMPDICDDVWCGIHGKG